MKAFSLVFTLNLFVFFLSNYLIDIESMFRLTFDKEMLEVLEGNDIILDWREKYLLPGSFIGIHFFLKVLAISLFVFSFLYLFGKTQTQVWKDVFSSVCFAELIFVIEKSINILVFVSQPNLTFEFVSGFSPVSIYSIFSGSTIPSYFSFLFRSLNLYEVAYIFALGFLISEKLDIAFSTSLKYVFFSYGTLMACWITFVTFMLLNS